MEGDQLYAKRPLPWVPIGIDHHGIDIGDNTIVHFSRCKFDLQGNQRDCYLVVRTNMRAFAKSAETELAERSYDYFKGLVESSFFCYDRRYKDKVEEYVNAPLPDDSSTIVDKALSLVGHEGGKNGFPKYHPTSWNCEHFATFVRKDIPFSNQAEYRIDKRKNLEASIGEIILTGIEYLGARHLGAPQGSKNFKGCLYETEDGIHYIEAYQEPGTLSPQWYEISEDSSSYTLVNPGLVPYPLQELTLL